MALVLAATGLFLSLRFRAELDHTLNQGLRARAVDVGALVQQADTGLRDSARASEPGADFAQVLYASDGRVLDATPGFGRRPLLSAAELRAATRRPIMVVHPATSVEIGRTKLRAAPVSAQGRRVIVVVGASLDDRDEALTSLRNLLLVGGPAALLLASLAGYALTTTAMRPVSRLLGRLAAGLARERAFTADASHELRTPLTMLTTELQLMARDRPVGPAFDTAIGAAIEEADRLGTLLADLLVLARSDAEQLPLAPEDVDVRALAEEVAGRFARAGADVAVAVPAELRVRADRRQLERALGNLLANATRHGAAPIEVATETAGDHVEIHVRDGGPGIPAAFLPHAFDRFARPDPGQAESGTGLGLAIVDAVARSHGGSAHAANRPEGGADVWMSIPSGGHLTLASATASEEHARDDLPQPARPDPTGGRRHRPAGADVRGG
jgi:signal transduction histidine kinase